MSADEDPIASADADRAARSDADAARRDRPIMFPGAGATPTQGLGTGGGILTGSPVVPPVLADEEEDDSSDGLAGRIEQVLAEDGRFARLLPGLSYSADRAGRVTLAGSLPDDTLRSSLLATVRAVPGVAEVSDRLTTA